MFPSAKKVRNHRGILNEYDCGCMVVRDSAGTCTIHACSMHNAAAELAALVQSGLDAWSKSGGGSNLSILWSQMYAWQQEARTALAKAETA